MSLSQPLCTFFLAGHFFGIPVAQVLEVIQFQEMTRVPLAPHPVLGMINLRGQIVTAVDLRRRLRMAERPAQQRPVNVVVRTGNGAVSLLVDEIGDVLEAEEDTLESPPETLQGWALQVIRGVYKLPDRLLLVLDADRAADVSDPVGTVMCEQAPGNHSASGSGEPPTEQNS